MGEAKIFVRERSRNKEKGKKPRFRVVATMGTDIKIKVCHMRKRELEELAKVAKAELIYMEDTQDRSGN